MILAEKQYYSENRESVQVRYNRPQPVIKNQPKPNHRIGSKIASVILLVVCFATASLVIYRYAAIAENHSKILELNRSLEKEYAKRENLKVDLAFTENLSNIEASAGKNLGMSYPGEDQVVYVELPEEENNSKKSQVVQMPEENFWSRLFGFLN